MLTIRWSDIRTLGNPLTVVAAILVVVLLSLLIVETRAVKTQYYVSHAERMRAIETTQDGIISAMAGMTAAFETGVEVSPSVEPSFDRLRENNRILQALDDVPRHSPQVQSHLEHFDSSLERWLGNSEVFIARQNAQAAALQSLQDNSPDLVRHLRERGLTAQSQALFAIALDTIEYEPLDLPYEPNDEELEESDDNVDDNKNKLSELSGPSGGDWRQALENIRSGAGLPVVNGTARRVS